MESTTQMNIQYNVEILTAHLFQRSGTCDTRVMNEDIDSTIMLKCGIDDRSPPRRSRHGLGAGNRLPPCRPDLLHHPVCGPVSLRIYSCVVDDHLRASRCKQQGIAAP